jgi:hypothetical protein
LLGDGTVAGATLSVTPAATAPRRSRADYINAISMLDPVAT